jgi:pyruvate dehydrogenase E2 component (dihydrolipoamide acetyltransferase)
VTETDEPPQQSEGERETEDEHQQEAAQRAGPKVKSERESRSNRQARAEPAYHDDDEADFEEAEDEEVSESDTLPPPAGPATRRLARRLGVDLETVEARDPSGRITQEDVVEAHDRLRESSHQPSASQPALPDFERFGPIRREPLNKIARTAMERLQASWSRVPQVTQHDQADITELEFARREYLARQSDSGPKITITAIVIKAVTSLLARYPKFNASLDPQAKELILKEYYHIGVAVDTEHGLLVPVIQHTDRKNVIEVAEELEKLAHRARQRKLRREEMEGATFTLSNQGSIGGTAFTPIVTHPQVAILGLSRAEPQMKLFDEQPRQRLLLPLSLSYDHRVVNGADAARFLAQLADDLSNYFQILVHA